jgi:glycogen operon protein
LENNRDGTDQNFSYNFGVEGPSADPAVRRQRFRRLRNMLATLLLSQGVPMLLAGDEFARSQRGNNNAYCQDNEISWLDWSGIDNDGRALMEFVRRLIALRREHVVFRRRRFFHGRPTSGTATKDITWLKPDGGEFRQADWQVASRRALSFLISGEAGDSHLDRAGVAEPDDTFLVLLNAADAPLTYRLPADGIGRWWEVVIDTSADDGLGEDGMFRGGETVAVEARCLVVFVRREREPDGG